MTLEWRNVIVHSADPAALGQWWAEALGWVVVHSSDVEFAIRPEADRAPGLEFVRLDEPRKAKSRLRMHCVSMTSSWSLPITRVRSRCSISLATGSCR